MAPRVPRVPMFWRLPNASPWFVGREREIARLLSTVARSPVAVVSGPAGIGKSELVRHAFGVTESAHRARTVVVPFERGSVSDPIAVVRRALGAVLDVSVSASASPDDRDEGLATILELADGAALIVVLDGFEPGDDPERTAFVAMLARYAAGSRWVVTSRASFDDIAELGGCRLALGPLGSAGLIELAARRGAALPEDAREAAVIESGGSPGALLAALDARETAGAGAQDVADLAPEVQRALRWLVVSPGSLRPEAVGLGQDGLGRLRAFGWIEEHADGIRARAVFRATVAAALTADERRVIASELAAHLADDAGAPVALLAALEVAVAAEDKARVVTLLTAHGDALVRDGDADVLWRACLLAETAVPDALRFRVALLQPQPEVLASLLPPFSATPDAETRVAWSRVLEQRGDLREALASLGNDGAVALRRAELLIRQGDASGALGALARAVVTPDEIVSAAITAGTAHALLGDFDAARVAFADAERGLLDHGGASHTGALRCELARGLLLVADLERAARVLAPIDGRLQHMAGHVRSARLLLAQVHEEGGALTEADAALDAIRPPFPASSPDGLEARLLRARLAFSRGAVAEAEGLFVAVADDAREAGLWDTHYEALSFLTWIDKKRGTSVRSMAIVPDAPPSPLFESVYALRRVDDACRAAAPLPTLWPEPGAFVEVRTRAYAHQVRGLAYASMRRFPEAVAELDAAVALQRARGLWTRVFEAEALFAEVLILAGDFSRLATVAHRLGALAETRLDAAPPARVAAFYAAVAAAAPPRVFIGLAARPLDDGTSVARLARALVGLPAPLDRIERDVFAAIRAHLGWCVTCVGPAPPSWWFDGAAIIISGQHDLPVDLRRKPTLAAALACIADAPTAVGFETLFRDVWGAANYHPLQHDNRVRLAIHKLRALVEDDPREPTRLVTSDAGYRVVGLGRVRSCATGPEPQN